MKWLKRLLIGKPLRNEALQGEKYSVFWGLPILASDAVSSVAYALEEILWVLIPAISIMAYFWLSWISAAIIGLLGILIISYRQTIQRYPNGGGSYIVASDNLGPIAGVMAGASLAIGYILTVAVSIAAGTAAITSAFPSLIPLHVEICLIILILMHIGNMRGIRESAKIFALPTYAFLLVMIFMIIYGIIKVKLLHFIPEEPASLKLVLEPLSLFLILRAFSSGCAALTGVEAVSNAVPNFREPAPKNANNVLILLALIVLVTFGGATILANLYHVVPLKDKTVLSQISLQIFDGTPFFFMFYVVQVLTTLILALAANTAFAGFPMLFSVMGRDGYAPRQLSQRGERLGYSNGINLLTLLSALLLIAFKGDTHTLIPLYAVGVFISFTLSQAGILFHWLRSKEKGWRHKALINGSGALITLITVIVVSWTKFTQGAWIVIVVVPFIMMIFLKIKRHYLAVAEQLRLSPEELAKLDLSQATYHNHVIVPIESINKASVRALRYARTISTNIIAFNVAINEEAEQKIRENWELLHTDIPLVVKLSPYRKVLEPLLEFIESYENYSYVKGDIITIIMPQFSVNTWWHIFMHNQTRLFIQNDLLKLKHVVVATMPLQLKKDWEVPVSFKKL